MYWVISMNHIERAHFENCARRRQTFFASPPPSQAPFLYILPMSFIKVDHDLGFRKKRRRPSNLFFVVFLTRSISLLVFSGPDTGCTKKNNKK